MNLFHFLKSTRGAIKTLPALALSIGAGALFTYTVSTTTHKQIEDERAVRSLTSIETMTSQQSMHRQGDLLTSINVRDGRNQVATAQERAALQGKSALARYENNQRALKNLGAALDRAAQVPEGEIGLNTGNRNAVQSADLFTVGNPNANAKGDSVDKYVQQEGSQGGAEEGATRSGGGQQPQLTKASMTHATGNSFNATAGAGAVSGGISGEGSTRAGGEGPARLSGAMPEGSNIVSRREGAGLGTHNNNNVSFGRERNARVRGGSRNVSAADEMRDIVAKSAAAARHTETDSANEAGRAFMANAINSGGISVEGVGDAPTASSADLAATDRHLRAIGNKLNNVGDKDEQRKKDQKSLIIQLIATVVGSIGLMVGGAALLSKLDTTINALKLKLTMMRNYRDSIAGIPFLHAAYVAADANVKILEGSLRAAKLKRWIAAGVMIATGAALNGMLMANAIKFMSKYQAEGGTNIAKAAMLLAPVMMTGVTYLAIKPQTFKSIVQNVKSRLKSAFDPVGLLTNNLMGMFK